MATKTCPKCSEAIQAQAMKCKHCHADLRSWFARHKILTGIMGFFGLIIIMAAIGEDPNTNTTNSASNTKNETVVETISISAQQLYSEYKENQIAADLKYENQILEVSGTVENIGKDILDDMYVSLNTGDIIGSVQCMLEDSELDKAVNLVEGQSIVVRGKNSGMLMNVILRNCVIQ